MSRASMMLIAVLLCVTAVQAERIDNPEYQQWAKFKPGASATTEMVSKMGENVSKVVTTHTLKELDENKAVIETLTVMHVADQEIKQTTKRDVPAKIDKPEEPKEGEKPEVKKGEETIKVKAGTFKCDTVETHMKQKGRNIVSKVWTCQDVPGGVVKMTSRMDGEMPMTTEGELTKVTKGE